MCNEPRVLSIQSHVVHGYVGNKSAVFPLQLLGFEVDSINTVQFCAHTGYKHVTGTILKNEEMLELMKGLQLNGIDRYTHFLTGYSVSPEALKYVVQILKGLKEKNPDLVYVCDPVMGDNGMLYVPETMLPIYRDMVVPLADILTPNQFEAELITGHKINCMEDAIRVMGQLHDMGVKIVVLSSTELGNSDNMVALVSSDNKVCYKIVIPRVEASFVGTGDLFASLFMAWCHHTNNDIKLTLERCIATMQTIVKDTFTQARVECPNGKIPPSLLELRLVRNKSAIERPHVTIEAERIY